jgi:hypothetical protein
MSRIARVCAINYPHHIIQRKNKDRTAKEGREVKKYGKCPLINPLNTQKHNILTAYD